MKTLTFHRAKDAPEPVSIILGEPFDLKGPSGEPATPAAVANVVTFEAEAIANAIFDNLPLAVSIRLTVVLMQRYATNHLGGPKRS